MCNCENEIIEEEFNKLLQKDNQITFSIVYNDYNKTRQWVHFFYSKTMNQLTTYKTCSVDTETLELRISNFRTILKNKKIAIFGLGAIGSFVATSLGRHGLNTIKIIDRDVLEPVNTIRHALGTSYIGISKVIAVATKINSQALGFTTVEQFDDKGFQMDNYREIIEDVDIVVDCTANKNFSLMLNQLCLEKHKTAVYITSHRKAFIGKVILVRPNIDPCLCCYYGENGIIDNHKENNYPFLPIDKNDEINLGCGSITYSGISSDIEMIANWGVKIVLKVLQNAIENNFCLIVNELINESDLHIDFTKEGHVFKTFLKKKGCEICGK